MCYYMHKDADWAMMVYYAHVYTVLYEINITTWYTV